MYGDFTSELKGKRPGQLANYNEPKPDECTEHACSVCGACSTCRTFHYYTGNGCTEDTCQLLRQSEQQ